MSTCFFNDPCTLQLHNIQTFFNLSMFACFRSLYTWTIKDLQFKELDMMVECNWTIQSGMHTLHCLWESFGSVFHRHFPRLHCNLLRCKKICPENCKNKIPSHTYCAKCEPGLSYNNDMYSKSCLIQQI